MFSALLLAQVVLELGNGSELRFTPGIRGLALYIYYVISEKLGRHG